MLINVSQLISEPFGINTMVCIPYKNKFEIYYVQSWSKILVQVICIASQHVVDSSKLFNQHTWNMDSLRKCTFLGVPAWNRLTYSLGQMPYKTYSVYSINNQLNGRNTTCHHYIDKR